MDDFQSDLQRGVQDVLELLDGLPDDLPDGVSRPELEQVLARLWLHGAAWGEELTLERLRVLYERSPSIALSIVKGADPDELAEEILLRDGRERHRSRRRVS